MKLVVIQRGQLRDEAIVALRDAYCTRFRRFGVLRVVESRRTGAAFWPSGRCWKVALDERGDAFTSTAFAQRLERWAMAHGEIAIAVGDADGHDPAALALADTRWSLGPMTLPHQLAHLVAVEQLYRAATILAHLPYHHGT